MKSKTEPYCPDCESSDVVVDSTSAWYSDAEKWLTVSVFDMPWWCSNKDCDTDDFNHAEWRDVKEESEEWREQIVFRKK